MNLGSIRDRVYDILGQETSSTVQQNVITTGATVGDDYHHALRWPAATLDEYINDGNRDMAVRSGCGIQTAVFTPVADQHTYSMPTDLVRVLRFYRTDTAEKVWPVDLTELDSGRPSWQTSYSNRLEWYFMLGIDKLVTGPLFADVGDTTYKLVYAKDPGLVSMVANDDEPTVPRKYHEALVWYTVGRSLMVDSTGVDLEQATRFYGDYQKSVKALRRLVYEHLDRLHTIRPEDITRAELAIFAVDGGTML